MVGQNPELSAKQVKAVELLASLKHDGNLDRLCHEVGVSRDTLWRWRKMPEFMGAVHTRARELMGDRIPKAADKLASMAENGDLGAIDRLFKITGFHDNDTMNLNIQSPLTLLIELAEKRKNGAGIETD